VSSRGYETELSARRSGTGRGTRMVHGLSLGGCEQSVGGSVTHQCILQLCFQVRLD